MLFFKQKEYIGVIFVILAYFSFSVLDAVQKTAIIYHSVFQLLLAKYCFVFFLSFFESFRLKKKNFYRTKNLKLQLLRSILSVVESALFILSFKYLSLANAHSIGSLTPVIVVALSVYFLKEKISIKTWIAIFIGFTGVLIIMKPGLSIFDSKSLIPLAAAFALSFYQVITRKSSQYDSPETSLFYSSIIGIALTSVLSYFFWQELSSNSFVFFVAVGIFYSLGLYFQIIALTKSRASIIQPFHYTLIFWAIILGYIFYNDIPDYSILIGAAIITFSGIYALSQKNTE